MYYPNIMPAAPVGTVQYGMPIQPQYAINPYANMVPGVFPPPLIPGQIGMVDKNKVTDTDVSNFLKAIIELGNFVKVDDSPDMYLRYVSDDNKIMHEVDGKQMPLAIYGTKSSDSIIINPFSEGNSSTTNEQWFYKSTKNCLGAYIIAILKKMLLVGAAGKKKTKEDESDNREAIRLLGKYAGDIDEKMVKEFNSISADLDNFFGIHYDVNTKITDVKCTIFIEARHKAFSNVRVHTWEVLQGITKNVLGTENMNDFAYKSTLIGCPVFEGFVHVLVRVYQAIQHALPLIDRRVNLVNLESHLKYFDQYYEIAKWCKSISTNTGMVSPMNPIGGVPLGAMPMGAAANPMFNPMLGTMPFGMMKPVGTQLPFNAMPVSVPIAPPINMQPLTITSPIENEQPGSGANRHNPFAS